MHFISEVYWNKGKQAVNQDSVSLQEVCVKGKRVIFALVCDGIGGLWSGEQASGFVAEQMTEWFYKEALPMIIRRRRRRKIMRAGIRALYDCNEEMRRFAEENKIKFGTALTMLLIQNNSYLLWHSGDVRAYRICSHGKSSHIARMTKDHSTDKYTLTRCVGSFKWQQPDVEAGYFFGSSTFLLCTDGFRHIVTEQKISETLQPKCLGSREQIYTRIKEIAEYSQKHGETDNISAAVIKAG